MAATVPTSTCSGRRCAARCRSSSNTIADGSLESRGAAANDLNMLVSTGGRQRSETEFRSLYADAGFRLTRIVPTPARVSIIEGAPSSTIS